MLDDKSLEVFHVSPCFENTFEKALQQGKYFLNRYFHRSRKIFYIDIEEKDMFD